mgnify:FL=1
MYLVKNVSKFDISIPDLRITLAPGDQIDLDMVASRFYIDQSSSLRRAFGPNGLKCVYKNGGGEASPLPEAKIATTETPANKNDSVDVINAVKQLEEKLSKRLDEKMSSQPQIDLNLLNQTLSALQGVVSQVSKPKEEVVEQKEIDDPRIVDIHKRTLNRLSSNLESNVRHEEQTTDNNVTKNIQELENLQ